MRCWFLLLFSLCFPFCLQAEEQANQPPVVEEIEGIVASKKKPREELEEQLLQEIRASYDPDQIPSESTLYIQVDAHSVANLPSEIEEGQELEIIFLQQGKRFKAFLSGEETQRRKSRPITGKVIFKRLVPVLKRHVLPGSKIQEEDIEYIEVPTSLLTGTTLMDPSLIIGATPKGSIRVNVPIKTTDIRQPQAVKKGENVKIRIKKPHIIIEGEGKALEAGVVGDVIQVLGQDKKRTLYARIIGQRVVEVENATLTAEDCQ